MRYLIILMSSILFQSAFKQTQLKHARVKTAYNEKELVVKGYFKEKGLHYTGFNLFIRAFKQEAQLEVWIREKDTRQYKLLHAYAICTSSGTLGPKRKEGDYQVPEGIYEINHFNPQSNFHLSLGISYPNASDKILSRATRLGGDIYIHGNCVTIGCMPLTDDKIKELYVLAVEAKDGGQASIPVHIFPRKLTDSAIAELSQEFASSKTNIAFWNNLQLIYQDFETNHILKPVVINKKGEYHFNK